MATRKSDSGFTPSRAAERAYERQLKSVASQIETTLKTASPEKAEQLLRNYAQTLEPWAKQSATNMLAGVERKNAQAWRSVANRMGLDMRVLLSSPGVGATTAAKIADNIALIKGLALDSADKVASIVAEGVITGSRAEDLAKRIAAVGEVSVSRARTIAHTEVSKAGTALSQARATSVGSTGYIWRTARDGDTRDSHRAMEGQFVPWDKPPTLDNMQGHAGEFPNCRCYPEPVVPNNEGGVYKPPLPTQGQEKNSGEQALLSQYEKQVGSQVVRHVANEPLYNVSLAKFDSGKLVNYSMDFDKEPNKARAWKEALGFEKNHAELVEKQIMAWLPEIAAVRKDADKWGERFAVDIPINGLNGKMVDVRSAWIYDMKNGKISTKPRLTSVYIPKRSK